MAVKITYNGSQIASTEESGNINLTYNGSTIATMSAGTTKTVNCNGLYMLSNLAVGSKTLNCANKIMASNVGVEYEQVGIPLTITSAGSTTARTGYYQSYIRVNGVAYSERGTYYFPVGTVIDVYCKSNTSGTSSSPSYVAINGVLYSSDKSGAFVLAGSFEVYSDTTSVSVALINSRTKTKSTVSQERSATPFITISSEGSSSTTSTYATSYVLVNGSTIVTEVGKHYLSYGSTLEVYVKSNCYNSGTASDPSYVTKRHYFYLNDVEKFNSTTYDSFRLDCKLIFTTNMSNVTFGLVNIADEDAHSTTLDLSTTENIITSVGGGSTSTVSTIASGYFMYDSAIYTDEIVFILPDNTPIQFYGKAGGLIGTYYAVVKLNGTEVGTKTTDKKNIVLLYTYSVTTDATIDLDTNLTNRIMTITT